MTIFTCKCLNIKIHVRSTEAELKQQCKMFHCNPQPITRRQVLDWSKLKHSAYDNFKFDENSRKFSKRVENTVGKGEIARYKQFLLFPQCFQKACFLEVSKGVIVWEWVKPLHKIPAYKDPAREDVLKKHCGKRRKCLYWLNQSFLLFQKCFLLYER